LQPENLAGIADGELGSALIQTVEFRSWRCHEVIISTDDEKNVNASVTFTAYGANPRHAFRKINQEEIAALGVLSGQFSVLYPCLTT
jgi:hypothetical protein